MLQDDEKYLEELLRAGRVGPDAEQVERLERRVEPSFALARESRSRFQGLAEHASRLKWVVAAVAIGLLSSTIASRGITTNDAEREPAASPNPNPNPNPDPNPNPAPVVAQNAEPPASPPRTEPEDVKPRLAAAPAPAATTRATRTIAPAVTAAPAPSEASQEPSNTVATSNSVPEPRADATQATTDTPTTASEPRPTGESEVAYLRRAQAAMASNPQRALALAEEHPSRFPNAALVQEREVIAIDALVKLRRTAEARARIAAFRARFPQSAHLAHVLSAAGDAL